MSGVAKWERSGTYSSAWHPVKGDYVEVWEADSPNFPLSGTWVVSVGPYLRLTGASDTVTQAKIEAAHYYRALKEASKP